MGEMNRSCVSEKGGCVGEKAVSPGSPGRHFKCLPTQPQAEQKRQKKRGSSSMRSQSQGSKLKGHITSRLQRDSAFRLLLNEAGRKAKKEKKNAQTRPSRRRKKRTLKSGLILPARTSRHMFNSETKGKVPRSARGQRHPRLPARKEHVGKATPSFVFRSKNPKGKRRRATPTRAFREGTGAQTCRRGRKNADTSIAAFAAAATSTGKKTSYMPKRKGKKKGMSSCLTADRKKAQLALYKKEEE